MVKKSQQLLISSYVTLVSWSDHPRSAEWELRNLVSAISQKHPWRILATVESLWLWKEINLCVEDWIGTWGLCLVCIWDLKPGVKQGHACFQRHKWELDTRLALTFNRRTILCAFEIPPFIYHTSVRNNTEKPRDVFKGFVLVALLFRMLN